MRRLRDKKGEERHCRGRRAQAAGRQEESDKGVIPKEGRQLSAGEENEAQLMAEVGRVLHPTLSNGLCRLEPGEDKVCVGEQSTGVWLSRNCASGSQSWQKMKQI